jgi:alanyl-tRNA synthetase
MPSSANTARSTPNCSRIASQILENLTREEIRFARTVESATERLQSMLDELKSGGQTVLDGGKAFDLYATNGLPFEITRDIAREQNLDVDEAAFNDAKKAHSLASGGGKAMGVLGGDDAEFFGDIFKSLRAAGKLPEDGVQYDPYESLQVNAELLALVVDGQVVTEVQFGDEVELILPKTGFYIESGGQVSDTGYLRGADWEIEITDSRRPAAGLVSLMGEVIRGKPRVGDKAIAEVDYARRHDTMRNHTATHLLHAALHQVLGGHARQAGSYVGPDHLRFDFNHPQAMTEDEKERVERLVNQAVAADYTVLPREKSLEQATAEGAMALFGEKYGNTVRTITIGDPDDRHSYELCGGTHLERTSDVGAFFIVREEAAAAGVRRIEAVTGRGAYEFAAKRFKAFKQTASALKASPEESPIKAESVQAELAATKKALAAARAELAKTTFEAKLANVQRVAGVNLLVAEMPGVDKDALTALADTFRAKFPENGVCVIASTGEAVTVMAAATQDLIKKGIKAGDLVGFLARQLGAGGGGAPHLAFGGAKDASNLPAALASVQGWLAEKA